MIILITTIALHPLSQTVHSINYFFKLPLYVIKYEIIIHELKNHAPDLRRKQFPTTTPHHPTSHVPNPLSPLDFTWALLIIPFILITLIFFLQSHPKTFQ